MQYYFAPLEGLTDSIYRRLHHHFFPGLDRYYTPFFSPTVHRSLTPREARELPPADCVDFTVIPQLLTKVPEDFLWMSCQCADLGYKEVNLNLGCPSGTVTSKGKGAGMLRQKDELNAFLEAIYKSAPLPVSIKTRIGFESPDEFPALLEIFNQYPVAQLTVHPRVRSAFYKGNIHTNAFAHAVSESKNPLCYNGNLNSIDDIEAFHFQNPGVDAVMLGRGLIADPGMLCPSGTERQAMQQFHDALLGEYLIQFGGSRNAMFRMKENWSFMIYKFENAEKLSKKLRKTTDIAQYRDIVQEIFETLPMRSKLPSDW